ncbi:MAG: DUF853 family protein [Candidatus Aenigmarchaeota archaeon]|nr:DUF853 family protein [Candidatus Aenigmarchaeota archaeon]
MLGKAENCIRYFNITVPKAEPPGDYSITAVTEWQNPNSSTNSSSDTSAITVDSNPILEIDEAIITTTVLHNSINSTSFTLNAAGNDHLYNSTFTCLSGSGQVCDNFTVTFIPNIYENLTAGSTTSIQVNVSVPIGYDPGEYTGTIRANATDSQCDPASRCWDDVTINVTVPISRTWTRLQAILNPVGANATFDTPYQYTGVVYNNASGFLGNITINNTGNIVLNFTITSAGNVSSLLVYENIIIPKQTVMNLSINYSIPINQTPTTFDPNLATSPTGAYTGKVIITAEPNSSPPQLNTSVSLDVRDYIAPVINWFNITTPSTPGIVDLNKEQVRFEANVTDNIKVSKVWIVGSEFGGGTVMYDDGTNGDLVANDSIYTIVHNFTTSGTQSVYIYTKDTSRNDATSSTKNFDVIASTTGILIPEPSYKEITNVTYYDNVSFTLTLTFNNTGQGGAYAANISLDLSANFTSDSTFESCGKVEEQNTNGNCIKTFNITALSKILPGTYYINQIVKWENPDYSLANATNRTKVKITDKRWQREPTLIEETVYTNTIGEFNITINNTGEIPLNFTIDHSGNATGLISVPTYIYVENGTTKNLTINYSIPLTYVLGIYEQTINISNYTAYPPSRTTILRLNVSDDIKPWVGNTSLSKTSLEANYETIDIEADATDNVNISMVWAHVVAPYYTQDVNLSWISGNHYSLTYTPTKGGLHNVTVYANDTSNNINSSWAGTFNVTGTTDGTNEQLPRSKVFTTDETTGASFNISITVNNTGPGTMRFVNITITPEHVGDWIESFGNYTKSCGNLTVGQNCTKEFWIDIPVCASPGSKDVLSNVTWQNPDYSIGYAENLTDVYVNPNPVLEVLETQIVSTIDHNQQKQVGSFTIKSTGNTILTGIAYRLQGGDLPASWVSFNPASGSPGYTILGQCGANYSVNVTITTPQYQDSSLYWTKINTTTSNDGQDWLWLNITVKEDWSWSRTPVFQSRLTLVGTSGNMKIKVSNNGNINPINFSIQASGNATPMLSWPSNILVPKGTTEDLLIGYTIPPAQPYGIYEAVIGITNSSASPPTYNSYIAMNVTDLPPEISSESVSPDVIDIYESTEIRANVTDNGIVSSVWATITKPLGEENISLNQVGATSWYNNSYTPDQAGDHSIVIYAKDNKDLVSSSAPLKLTVIGTTNVSITPNVTYTVFKNITQDRGAVLPLELNLSNIGQGGAYFVNLSFLLPSNWIAAPSTLDFGNITENEIKGNESQINIPTGTPPGIYSVIPTANWTNPDNSFGQNTTLIKVNITSNPILEIVETSLTKTIQHNQSSVINFTLNSTGNDQVENISISCIGAECTNFSINFTPSQLTSLAPLSSQLVNVSINIPAGYSPETYSLTINASTDKTFDTVPLEITVPLNKSWNRTPASYPLMRVGAGSKGDVGIITIRSFANVPLLLDVSIHGNLSDSLSTNAPQLWLNETKTEYIKVNYTAPLAGGFYTANISIRNSTADPAELNTTIEMEALEFKVNILFATPNTNVKAGDAISIGANVTYEENTIEENVTFKVEFDSYECPLNSSTYNPVASRWDIVCIAPNIPDGRAYDLTLTGNYTTIAAIVSDTQAKAILYVDVTPPQFVDVTTTKIPGKNATIDAWITENVLVDKVLANVSYPNGSSSIYEMQNLTADLANTTFRLILENLTEEGDYDLVIIANDTTGNENNYTTWFDVHHRVFLEGQSLDADGNVLSLEFELYRHDKPLVEKYLIHEVETDKTGNYSKEIHKRVFDIKVKVLGHEIIFNDVNLTSNLTNPVKFDSVEKKYLPIPLIRRVLRGLGAESILNVSSIDLVLNFSGTDYEPLFISAISIYRCSAWNFYTRSCNTSWSKLGGKVNVAKEIVTLENLTSLSAYALAEAVVCGNGICEQGYGETYENCPADCPRPPVGPPTVPTPYLIPPSPPIPPFEEKPALPPFSLETDLIEATLHPGESRTYSIWISNNLDKTVEASLKVLGRVWEFIILEKDKIEIGPRGIETVKVKIFTLPTTPIGVYTGDIQIRVGEVLRTLPVTLMVVPEKEALLDIKVETLTKTLSLNDTLKYHVTIYNLGFKKKVDVHVTYRIKEVATEKILSWKEEEMAIETSLSFVRMFDLSEVKDLSLGKYFIEVEGKYDNRTATSVDIFEVVQPFWTLERIYLVIIIILTIVGVIGGWQGRRMYKRWKLAKLRYIMPVDYKTLPTGKIWLGEVAETKRRAEFSLDDLTTHVLSAGATGSGKTVSAMVVVEDVLRAGIPVVVFDPTAQWTGFVRPCRDKRMLACYKEFGIKEEEARPFKGMIYEVTDPKVKIDFKRYMKPGEITVFTLNKLTPGQFDQAVRNIIDILFKQGWEESPTLRLLVVFDEVHRLLERYGGKGGYVALERACREFRKWGIGLVMASQVLADFKEAIKGNVLTEFQLHTKGLEDIDRVEKKFGRIYAERVAREEIGVGMVQNPKYNKGRPWFVHFRPLLHSPHKLSDEDLETYKRFARELQDLEKGIEKLRKRKIDTTDIELELRLAEDKLKTGAFRMAEIYLESLKSRVKGYEK